MSATSKPTTSEALSSYVTHFQHYCDAVDRVIDQEAESLREQVDLIFQRTPKTSCWESCFCCLFPKSQQSYEHLEPSSSRIDFRSFLNKQLESYQKAYQTAQQIIDLYNQTNQYSKVIANVRSDLSQAYSVNGIENVEILSKKLQSLKLSFQLAYGQTSEKMGSLWRRGASFFEALSQFNRRLDSGFEYLKKQEPHSFSCWSSSREPYFPKNVFSVGSFLFIHNTSHENFQSSNYPYLQEALDLYFSRSTDEEEAKEDEVRVSAPSGDCSKKNPLEELQKRLDEAKTQLQKCIEEEQEEIYKSCSEKEGDLEFKIEEDL